MLAKSAIRILRRLLGAPARGPGDWAGEVQVLDGNSALALLEAGLGEGTGLGASFPARGAELAWRAAVHRHPANQAGAALAGLGAEGPRGALAAAMGQAMSGLRAACFLSGPDLAACGDLLQSAAGRHLPLVIYLVNRALGGPGPAPGGGHEAAHLAAESGCLVLVAANVQEAVDLALIGRRVAEQALLPCVLALDPETALGLQDVRLPPAPLLDAFLGRPGDRVDSPDLAQRLLFGESRRRLPRWHDPERPVLLGAAQPPEVWGLARAATEVFLRHGLAATLEQACAAFAGHTGRTHGALSAYRMDDAKGVLVAQGAALETARLVADAARPLKIGVLGIGALAPFPAAELARRLAGVEWVAVLERVASPLAGDPPLLRALRAAVAGPRFLSVAYGLGGLNLTSADLLALCRRAETWSGTRVYLGINFAPGASPYPKRQVLLDQLRRGYPEIAALGLASTEAPVPLSAPGALTLALHRLAGGPTDGLTAEAALFLQRLQGGGVRTRQPPAAWGEPCVDLISVAAQAFGDPGDWPRVDLVLHHLDPDLPGPRPAAGLAPGGALLMVSHLPDEALWARLPYGLRSALRRSGASLHRVPPPPRDGHNPYLLGALARVLLDTGRLDASPRRLLSQYQAGTPDGAEAFAAGLERVRQLDLGNLPYGPAPDGPPWSDEAPALVRRLGQHATGYDSLPRFWDQVGVLFRNGEARELAPDPYLALGAVPPRAAGFRDLSPIREQLPAWDPALCSGCGSCWRHCPDGVIGALAASPARLLETSLRPAGAEALRPALARLATAAGRAAGSAGERVRAGFAAIQGQLKFPAERLAAMAQGAEVLAAWLEPLALAPLPGAEGEFLTLGIDPDACKACGICVATCAPGALRLLRQDPVNLAEARRRYGTWSQLPETLPATRQRLAQDPELIPGAAQLLAHGPARCLAGADGAEPGSGAKLALRLALAATEERQATLLEAFLTRLTQTREAIAGLIRGLLVDALPADDLDTLERGLARSGTGRTGLGHLIDQAGDAVRNAVDAERLRRLVELARGLADLAWRLTEGPQGGGRARWGLVLAPAGETCAASFPYSPYAGAVTLDPSGEGAQLAAGLLEGQLRQATEGLALLRKARLELERPADAARLWAGLDALSWRDLDPDERALCPPLWLAGDGARLAGPGLGQLIWLLGTGLPVKVLLLADLDLGLAAPPDLGAALATAPDPVLEFSLLALSQRRAYLAQTSLGVPGHLVASLEQALAHPGPALVLVHAPSPGRHGFAPELCLARAAQAVASRVWPLFRYDPAREGVFGTRLDLDDNPDPGATLAGDPPLSPAHWALGERRFAPLFEPLAETAPEPIPVADYLGLDSAARARCTPYVEQAHNGSAPQRLRPDPRLLQVCQERLDAWRLLQELAGRVTPFTAQVQREAEARVAATHQAALAAQAADYEARLQGLRAEFQQEVRQELRDRLLALSGYGANPGPG